MVLEIPNHLFHVLKEKSLILKGDVICKIDSVLYTQYLNSLVINMHVGIVKSHFLHNALMEMAVL